MLHHTLTHRQHNRPNTSYRFGFGGTSGFPDPGDYVIDITPENAPQFLALEKSSQLRNKKEEIKPVPLPGLLEAIAARVVREGQLHKPGIAIITGLHKNLGFSAKAIQHFQNALMQGLVTTLRKAHSEFLPQGELENSVETLDGLQSASEFFHVDRGLNDKYPVFSLSIGKMSPYLQGGHPMYLDFSQWLTDAADKKVPFAQSVRDWLRLNHPNWAPLVKKPAAFLKTLESNGKINRFLRELEKDPVVKQHYVWKLDHLDMKHDIPLIVNSNIAEFGGIAHTGSKVGTLRSNLWGWFKTTLFGKRPIYRVHLENRASN